MAGIQHPKPPARQRFKNDKHYRLSDPNKTLDYPNGGSSVVDRLKGGVLDPGKHKPQDDAPKYGRNSQATRSDEPTTGDREAMSANITRAMNEQSFRRATYGHKAGAGLDGYRKPPAEPNNPVGKGPKVPPDPSRGPTAKGSPEEIARADAKYQREEHDRANGITPPDERPDRPDSGLRRKPGESDGAWRRRSSGQHLSGGADPSDPNYPTGKPSDPRGPAQSKKIDTPDWQGPPPLTGDAGLKGPPPLKLPERKRPVSTAHPAPPKIPPLPPTKRVPRPPIPPYQKPDKPPSVLKKTGLGSYARARNGY